MDFKLPGNIHWRKTQSKEDREARLNKAKAKRKRKLLKRIMDKKRRLNGIVKIETNHIDNIDIIDKELAFHSVDLYNFNQFMDNRGS